MHGVRLPDGAAAASDSPMYRTLPVSTSSASTPTVSSIGVSGIDPMLVVQVDVVDVQPPQRTFDSDPVALR